MRANQDKQNQAIRMSSFAVDIMDLWRKKYPSMNSDEFVAVLIEQAHHITMRRLRKESDA